MGDQYLGDSLLRHLTKNRMERRIDAYLTAAPLSVLRLWSANGYCMLEAADAPRPAPRADIHLADAFWLVDSGAALLKPFCCALLDKAGFRRRGQWFECEAPQARALILRAAQDIRTPLLEETALRVRAGAIVGQLEERQQRQREKGELRGLASEYRVHRLRAEKRFPSWSAYMEDLFDCALAAHAAKEGRALMKEN